MLIVVLTAMIVGGATIAGTCIGCLCKHVSHNFSNIVYSFAAGIMLSAAILGLILPAISIEEYGGLTITLCGIFSGACCLCLIDSAVPFIHRFLGWSNDLSVGTQQKNKVLFFVFAMAIHNFPEGLAAGVSFGTGDYRTAMLIAGGIALQNIPEGFITVLPMLAVGVSPRKAFQCGLSTGLIEIAGTILGYLTITASKAILPFALAFAGGTMLFVVCDEMLPDNHSHETKHIAAFAFLAGFCLMLISDVLLN